MGGHAGREKAVLNACFFFFFSLSLSFIPSSHQRPVTGVRPISMPSPTTMPPFQSLADLEGLALAALPPMVAGYYASGAEDETTLADNRASWARWRILPRVMVDVSSVDSRAELFGEKE